MYSDCWSRSRLGRSSQQRSLLQDSANKVKSRQSPRDRKPLLRTIEAVALELTWPGSRSRWLFSVSRGGYLEERLDEEVKSRPIRLLAWAEPRFDCRHIPIASVGSAAHPHEKCQIIRVDRVLMVVPWPVHLSIPRRGQRPFREANSTSVRGPAALVASQPCEPNAQPTLISPASLRFASTSLVHRRQRYQASPHTACHSTTFTMV